MKNKSDWRSTTMTSRKELEAMADAHENKIFKNAGTNWISLGKDVCNDGIIGDAFIAGFLAARDAAAEICRYESAKAGPLNEYHRGKSEAAAILHEKIKALGETEGPMTRLQEAEAVINIALATIQPHTYTNGKPTVDAAVEYTKKYVLE
jgi:hypothetical protein